MQQAIGLIETRGMPSALVVADMMGKAADIRILGFENTDAGRISVIIQGTTGAVDAAIAATVANPTMSTGYILGHHILPCPDAAVDITTMIKHRQKASNADSLEWLDD